MLVRASRSAGTAPYRDGMTERDPSARDQADRPIPAAVLAESVQAEAAWYAEHPEAVAEAEAERHAAGAAEH